MSEILTREQLKLYKLCITDGSMYCNECSLYKIKGGCAELVCNTALYWQGKAERQAAALEQARIALIEMEIYLKKHYPLTYQKYPVTAAIAAIEGARE